LIVIVDLHSNHKNFCCFIANLFSGFGDLSF